MPEPDNILDVDFDSQLEGLVKQAERVIGSRNAAAASAMGLAPEEAGIAAQLASEERPVGSASVLTDSKMTAALPDALRPMILGIEAVSRAVGENTSVLQKIEKATIAEAEARHDLPKIIADLRSLLEVKNGVSHSMFSALHQELKGYKDEFLLQSVYRPIIRDLVSLYDDLAEIHRQVGDAIADGVRDAEGSAPALATIERMWTMKVNIEHNVEFIIEVLARLGVTPFPNEIGKLDKRTQRTVAIEPAEHPDEDTLVIRSVKPGFLWNERVLRPEEVVVKKWKSGVAVAHSSLPATIVNQSSEM